MDGINQNLSVILSFSFGVIALGVILVIALFSDNLNPLLITISRVILAIACAGVAAAIPGFISLNFEHETVLAIRAGGAIAVFVLVYFFNPPALIASDTKPPNPVGDFIHPANNWLAVVDSGNYDQAYAMAAISSQNDFSIEVFRKLFSDYLSPLGKLKNREFVGATSAETLPTGESGNFRVLTYKTRFEVGDDRLEVIVLTAENGEWKVRSHNYYEK